MGDRLKSAYELALERMKAKDAEAAGPALTPEQKARIAEIRAEFRARLDEIEFLHRAAVAEAQAARNAETLARLEEDYQRERARMQEQEEEQVRAVRGA